MYVGIAYGMNQLSTNTVGALVDVIVTARLALVSFVYRFVKTITG